MGVAEGSLTQNLDSFLKHGRRMIRRKNDTRGDDDGREREGQRVSVDGTLLHMCLPPSTLRSVDLPAPFDPINSALVPLCVTKRARQ